MIIQGNKRKSLVGQILGPERPEEKQESESPLRSAARSLIDAVKADDEDGVEAALRSAFADLSSVPSEED